MLTTVSVWPVLRFHGLFRLHVHGHVNDCFSMAFMGCFAYMFMGMLTTVSVWPVLRLHGLFRLHVHGHVNDCFSMACTPPSWAASCTCSWARPRTSRWAPRPSCPSWWAPSPPRPLKATPPWPLCSRSCPGSSSC